MVTDTEAYNEAVMIHSENALATDCTVVSAWWFQSVACFTVSVLENVFNIFGIVDKPIMLTYCLLNFYFYPIQKSSVEF